MDEDLQLSQPTRDEFMGLLWDRATDPSLSHLPITLRYMQMYAKYNGWEKPVVGGKKTRVIFTLGEDADG